MPGRLVDGKWTEVMPSNPDPNERTFNEKVSSEAGAKFPVEADRYHLYFSWSCPFAHRALLMHSLMGLDKAISRSAVDAVISDQGWSFGQDKDTGYDTSDPVQQAEYLHQIYSKVGLADPHFTGRVVVPTLLDKKTGLIVSNDSYDLMRMFANEFRPLAKPDAPNFRPESMAAQIDQLNDKIIAKVNRGVYGCAFAPNQETYEKAYDALFECLEECEAVLAKQRYLNSNDQLTESDLLLFATLVRFDVAYYSLFKCNKHRIEEYPNLHRFLVDLYQMPEIKCTIAMKIIRINYWRGFAHLNPSKLVPKGPVLKFMQ